jgi:hypothetical protein
LNENMTIPAHRSVVLPILVVPDETLWVVNYAERGTLQEGPMLRNQAEYFIGHVQGIRQNYNASFTISHLHIVTKTGLNVMLRRLAENGEDAEQLKDMCTD